MHFLFYVSSLNGLRFSGGHTSNIFRRLNISFVCPRASGSAVILDPRMICKKNRRTRGRLAQICRNETGLLKEITKGVTLGATECAHQFRNRRWNCTTQRRSMRKILMRGKTFYDITYLT